MLRLVLITLLLSTFAHATDLSEALLVRKQIAITPKQVFLQENTDEQIALPMGHLLMQGKTDFCWAFSTFHMVRTYYNSTSDTSAETRSWQKLIDSLDSSEALTKFIYDKVKSNHGGWPSQAIAMMEAVVKPALHPWFTFIVGSFGWGIHSGDGITAEMPQAWYESSSEIEKRIHRALSLGSPAVYCTTKHCNTIYGATYKHGYAASYQIADSLLKDPYSADPNRLMSNLADLTTIALAKK